MSEISVLGGVSPLPATSGLTSGAARTPPSSGERNAFRQALVGLLTAGLAVLAVGGSLLLTLAEGGIPRDTPVAQVTLTETAVPTATQTPLPPSRTPTIGPTTDGQPTAANPPTPSPTATATAAPIMLPTACAPPAGWARVIVQPGDTLFHYAMQSGLSVMALQHANCLPSTTIFAGTRLYVPPYAVPVVTAVPCGPPLDWVLGYTVQPGDNLFRLSLRFGVTLYALQRANCLPSSSYITVGQLLFVPRTALATSTPTPAPTQTATQPPPPPPAPTDTPQPTLTPSPVPPTASPVPPTATPVPPTSTPIPPTPVPPTPTPVPPTATPIPPTPTGSPTPPTATSTPTPTPTASPSPTATATPPSTDAPTPTPSPTATSTDLPPPTPSETPTPTATPT